MPNRILAILAACLSVTSLAAYADSDLDDLLQTGIAHSTPQETAMRHSQDIVACREALAKIKTLKPQKCSTTVYTGSGYFEGIGQATFSGSADDLIARNGGDIQKAIVVDKEQAEEFLKTAQDENAPSSVRDESQNSYDVLINRMLPDLECRAGNATEAQAIPPGCDNALAAEPTVLAPPASAEEEKLSPADPTKDYAGLPCSWFLVRDHESCASRSCFYSEGQSVAYGQRAYQCKSGAWDLRRDCTEIESRVRRHECITDIKTQFGIPSEKETPAQHIYAP